MQRLFIVKFKFVVFKTDNLGRFGRTTELVWPNISSEWELFKWFTTID